jgi:hypothetical protein
MASFNIYAGNKIDLNEFGEIVKNYEVEYNLKVESMRPEGLVSREETRREYNKIHFIQPKAIHFTHYFPRQIRVVDYIPQDDGTVEEVERNGIRVDKTDIIIIEYEDESVFLIQSHSLSAKAQNMLSKLLHKYAPKYDRMATTIDVNDRVRLRDKQLLVTVDEREGEGRIDKSRLSGTLSTLKENGTPDMAVEIENDDRPIIHLRYQTIDEISVFLSIGTTLKVTCNKKCPIETTEYIVREIVPIIKTVRKE